MKQLNMVQKRKNNNEEKKLKQDIEITEKL